MDPGELVGQMLAAPAALAYLDIARASGLPPEQAADPLTALFLAAAAVDLVGPWRDDREVVGEHLAGARDGLAAYARAVAAEDALTGAWFAPLDRQRQVWIEGRHGGPPAAGRFTSPVDSAARHGGWEAYAQKSAGGLYTCTALDGVHPVRLGEPDGDIGDYHPPEHAPMWRLPVQPDARVLEIRDAWDWHALCAAHPLPAREVPGAPEDSGIVTVDWSSVAGRWDGVHLTVGGLLLAEQRLVERDGVRTAHSAWDVEQTLWLRWVFGAPEPFQPVFAPGPELRLPEWYWRRLP